MKPLNRVATVIGMVAVVTGLLLYAGEAKEGPMLKDGELPLPADYKTWPRFLVGVPRPDTNQIRDIFINPVGAKVHHGEPFPYGTVMVMEIYRAHAGANGKLEKDELAKVFVMGKGLGWGQNVPDQFKTGEWVYAAYDPSGKPLAEDFTKCRACHAPLAQQDFVHRYEEYFRSRGPVH